MLMEPVATRQLTFPKEEAMATSMFLSVQVTFKCIFSQGVYVEEHHPRLEHSRGGKGPAVEAI